MAFNRSGKLVLSFKVCRGHVEKTFLPLANKYCQSRLTRSARKASARVITIPSSYTLVRYLPPSWQRATIRSPLMIRRGAFKRISQECRGTHEGSFFPLSISITRSSWATAESTVSRDCQVVPKTISTRFTVDCEP